MLDKDYAIQLAMEYGFTGSFDAEGNLTYDSEFVEAMLEAIQYEREACAKICEEQEKRWEESAEFESIAGSVTDMARAGTAASIANIIRARGEA